MAIVFYIFSSVLIILNLLPMVRNQHWVFRVWNFGRIQLLVLEIIASSFGWLALEHYGLAFYVLQSLLWLVIIQNVWLLLPYTPVYRVKREKSNGPVSDLISVISVNVYQFNTDYHLLIDLIKEVKPDIVHTVESNSDWENALSVLESDYPYTHKKTLENTYGMHFYSKIPIENAQTHHFVSEDIPSFEIRLKVDSTHRFTFFGVHPPPPSPSEEKTSKERDGDLAALAKRISKLEESMLVVGDFNNVAWGRSSQLFQRTSQLIDPRKGYGLVSTFHAKYKLLRVPIDLLFHSDTVYIEDFKTLRAIGSDHFPVYCSFYISNGANDRKEEKESRESGDSEQVEEMVDEGKKENGNRDRVAKE